MCLQKLEADVKSLRKFASFVGQALKKNEIFDLESKSNRDNCFYPYWLLKQKLSTIGIELNTADLNAGNQVEFELHLNAQRSFPRVPAYLLLLETPQVVPDNECQELLGRYKHIFTWNDDLVDNRRCTKINFPNSIVVNSSRGWKDRQKLCYLIAGNKSTRKATSLELYTARLETIRWFERNAPEDFDLYGVAWDGPPAKRGLVSKLSNRFQRVFLSGLGITYFPSYQGKVVSKIETLQKYRFNICYENIRDLRGYITEKLFDSFFAGCVPIYWGAPNIDIYVPEDCFIDRRRFRSHEQLYWYLRSISEQEYMAYQDRIASYLVSKNVYPFSAEAFANTIFNKVVADLAN